MANDTLSASIITLSDADRSQIGDEWAATAYQAVFTGSAVAGSYSAFNQRMETLKRFGNKSFMLSFWARAVSGTPRIGITSNQIFGSGGSPSANVQIPVGTIGPLTTNWVRYSIPITHPSLAGKTFGTAGGDFANIVFQFSDQGNFYGNNLGVQTGTVQLWGMQWELGTYVTPLERIDYQDDLKHCQRFYQILSGNVFSGWGAGPGFISYPYPVPMRAAPTIVLSGQSYSNASGLALNGGNIQTVQLSAVFTAIGYASGTIQASADL
jgi:hypothetical protein